MLSKSLSLADNTDCHAHLINNGVTLLDDGSVIIEFEPTGPSAANPIQASEFMCRIDNNRRMPCKIHHKQLSLSLKEAPLSK